MQTQRYAHWPEPASEVFAARMVEAFCSVLGATELIGKTGFLPEELAQLKGEIERAWGQTWFYDDIRSYWDVARSSGILVLPPIEIVIAAVRRQQADGTSATRADGERPVPEVSILKRDGQIRSLREHG